ncbi:nitrogen fixation negative regulator NifL [Methylomagnum ishizawai]|uniref:histidine kinase n=1 Tax=Methylomagnum ishizawai TaxID=1760988 RepID=A0A1Y6D8G1_9GAMM|nr:nitrogen fixation negative regulator NifL [Methylomagnum ishizawai]SMF96524.1 nitrogen fixation negative regulator NifL [Methylomagnum ishizawai]
MRYEQALRTLNPDTGKALAGLPEPSTENPQMTPLRLFMETMDQSPVAISITDQRANIIYVNQAFTRITGYSPEEAIGRNESMLSDKITPKRVYQDLWATLGQKKVWQGVLVNRHKTQGKYLADLTIAPMLDERGELTHYIGIHRDVTEFYGLEQKVKNQKKLIETVVDSIPVATVLLDAGDRVVFDNLVYKGLTSELGVAEPVQLFLKMLREEIGDRWHDLERRGKSFRNHEIRVDLGGYRPPRWFSCAGTWFSENDIGVEAYFQQRQQTYLLLTLTDITQQKRQQEEIRINALKAIMADEERIQSLRETLSGVIHQVQAPVNMLSAALNMLERRRRNGDDNAALAGLLKQALDSGQDTVATLQGCMPDPDPAKVAPVNINQVLHEVLILLTPRLLADGIIIEWQPTPVLPTIMALENRLRAMFKQLLENAIDAMRQNGAKPRELRIATRPEADLIHIVIEDSGPGIPVELRTKVFEPFFSTKGGAGRQAGMGLAMVQDVVNSHAGMIMIDPEYQDGCRIRLQFDIHHSAAN